MTGPDLAQLTAFAAVADQLSFRRAARQLGTSASAVSRTIAAFERRIGVLLFNRTTRSVSLTAAGRILADQALPALAALDRAVTGVGATAANPAGEVRISLTQLAAQTVFAPRLGRFAADYPGICLELVVDDTLTDVVAAGCDAGVRLETKVAQDMVAIPLTATQRTIIVGAPSYLGGRPMPQTPADLAGHRGILYRWGSDRAIYRWRLATEAGTVDATPPAGIFVSDADVMVRAAVAGAGLAFTLAARVDAEIESGTLVSILDDHCPVVPPFCLHYLSGRRPSHALRTLAATFRHRGGQVNRLAIESAAVD